MRRIGLLIAVVAAVGVSGCRFAESRVVTAAARLAQTCALGIARSVAPKDPADFARRPAPLQVDPASMVLATNSSRSEPDPPVLAKSPGIAETEILQLPISRDLGAVIAAAEGVSRARCTVLAEATTQPARRSVG